MQPEPSLLLVAERAEERNHLVQVHVVANENIIVTANSKELFNGLALMMACYYVFDIKYPKMSKGLLLFLQDVCFELRDQRGHENERNHRYNAFVKRLFGFDLKE